MPKRRAFVPTPTQERKRNKLLRIFNAPLPPVRPQYRYSGAVWAGVQVVDTFMRSIEDNLRIGPLITKNAEYDGIYKDRVNISLADAQALFAD